METDFDGYLSTPDGTQLVVGSASGLALMGNDGAAGKALPIAGQKDCSPTRWWDADSTVVVVHCDLSSQTQLWLVPIDGGTPTALTAPNNGQQGPDYGDMTAWQLPAGTYLQAAGACGVIFLANSTPTARHHRCRCPTPRAASASWVSTTAI